MYCHFVRYFRANNCSYILEFMTLSEGKNSMNLANKITLKHLSVAVTQRLLNTFRKETLSYF